MKKTSFLVLLLMFSISLPVAAEKMDLSDTAVLTELTDMAEHGYLDAQIILADWYYNGSQVEKNYAVAATYYELAAGQGHE